MSTTASTIIKLAQSWIGKKESNGTHREIIDIYNNHKPLARGYKVKYTDSWCATTISALAIKCNATDIIPAECSCNEMIKLFQKLGVWIENENRTPNQGDIIFYDWQDNGSGDNKGSSDHVGIVEKVSNGVITVIEGNKNDSVSRRTISVNGKFIRGYATPKYDAEPKTETKVDNDVLNLQKAINTDLKPKPLLELDNKCGPKTKAQMKKVNIKKPIVGSNKKYPNITKFVQGKVGATKDGKYGPDTKKKVEAYQKKNSLKVDGIVGYNTLSKMVS